MLTPNPEVIGAYEDAYRQAFSLDRSDFWQGYYYVSDASQYICGKLFDHILKGITTSVDQPVTVLDVGSGDNTFLESKVESYGSKIRALGISAVTQFPSDGVMHITGDLLRPSNWRPSGILEANSVDLAISNLTFMHFVDPLRALANTLRFIKLGGTLLTDTFSFRLSPESRDQTLRAILNDFSELDDTYGCPVIEDRGELIRLGGIFGNNGSELFENIVAEINPDWSDENDWSEKVIYSCLEESPEVSQANIILAA